MNATDTLPDDPRGCTPRRGSQIRYHYFHYFGGSHPWLASGSGWIPPVDLYETDTEIVVEANLCGINPEDVHIEIRGNTLELSGERLEHDGTATRCFHMMEIERGSFSRILEFPKTVVPESAQASSDHGMLVIRVTKRVDEIHGCSSADSMEGLE